MVRFVDLPVCKYLCCKYRCFYSEDDLQRCLQTESLNIVTDVEPKVVGSMCVRVAMQSEVRRPATLVVRAESTGKLSGSPCGTVIDARLSLRLETLEQRVQEFVKLSGCLVKRVTDIHKEGAFYKVAQSLSRNEVTDVSEYLIPAENSEGLITEAGNVVLQKLLVTKGVPKNCVYTGIDQNGRLCPVTYASIGSRVETVNESELEVFGIQRVMKSESGDAVEWHSYYSAEGCLISRKVVDSPFTMKVTDVPLILRERANEETVRQQFLYQKKELNWQTDLELHSKFLDRKKQLWAEHASYAAHNPDLRALLSDFLQHLLIDKPADVLDFCAQYFDAFSAGCGTVPEARGSGSGGSGMAGLDDDGVREFVSPQGSETRRMVQEDGYKSVGD